MLRKKRMLERRRSKKREAILELIQSSKAHPNAQWVYGQLKPRFSNLSLGTVYRNIKVLLDEGALASAGIVHGQERFDGDTQTHPHAVCKGCGLIIDLPESIALNVDSSRVIPSFTIDLRDTVFYGLCSDCKETAALGC